MNGTLRVTTLGSLLAGVAFLAGCEAKASVHAGVKEPEAFSAEGDAPASPAASPATASVPLTPVSSTTTTATTLPAGCSLVCNLADAKGRMAPEAEARFTTALAEDIETLRGCSSHASLTLRFDSAGALTEYGVDADMNSCSESVRTHHPALTYPGPAIVRCSERCGGRGRRGRGY